MKASVPASAGMPEYAFPNASGLVNVTARVGRDSHLKWDAPAGKVVVSHGAYTNGAYPVARAYLTNGVQTVCCIHFPLEEAQRLAADGVQGNILVMGHIAGDSVGINPYVARLRESGLEVTAFSGIIGG